MSDVIALPALNLWTLSDATKLSALAGLAQIARGSDNFNAGQTWQWTKDSAVNFTGGTVNVSGLTGGAEVFAYTPISMTGDVDVEVSIPTFDIGASSGSQQSGLFVYAANGEFVYVIRAENNGSKYFICGGLPTGGSTSVATTATSYSFRIVRVGGEWMGFYKTTGNWILLKSFSGRTTAAVGIKLEFYSNAGKTLSASFDNLLINKGVIAPTTSPTMEMAAWAPSAHKYLMTIDIPERQLPGASGSLEYQIAFNNGLYNDTWLDQTALKALINNGGAGTLITDPEHAYRLIIRFVSNGSQAPDIGLGYVTATDLDYPGSADLRRGVFCANGTIEGTCDVAAPSDVRLGVPADNGTGNFVSPAEAFVLALTGFGSNGTEFTGTYNPPVADLPSETTVLEATVYDNGQKTGRYRPAASVDIRFGVQHGVDGIETGDLVSPPESKVEDQFPFGSNGEFVGTSQFTTQVLMPIEAVEIGTGIEAVEVG